MQAGLAIIPLVPLALSAAHAGERATAQSAAEAFAQTSAAAAQPEPDVAADEATAMAAASLDPVTRWRPYVEEASRRFGVPAAWIEQVMRAESGGHARFNGRPITSRAGAMGLMQLMPATWSDMHADLRLGTDPYDPRDNILAGTAYLAALDRRFGYPGLFGAYNAGPARYAAWLAGRGALPMETRVYLARVRGDAAPGLLFADREIPFTAHARKQSPGAHPSVREQLFAVDHTGGDAAAHAPVERGEDLFVALSGAVSTPADN